jgi:hypothetical protein
MPWELLAIGAATIVFILGSLKGKGGQLVADSRILDKINRARQSAADVERARILEIEAEIRRNIAERENVQEDTEGAADRLRSEFGSG